MTQITPPDAPQSTWAYLRYRVNRDMGGALAWFSARWKESLLFKLAAAGFALFLVLWIALFVWLASDLPEAEALLTYETPLPTVVRGADGEIVHSYARERRVQLQYADFPQKLIESYLAAEDKTFFSHGGVDFFGTAGAVVDYLNPARTGRAVGGSTITQQVAKNLLLGDEYSVTRKLKEMILAGRIEQVLTKQEILELYLNEIPLGRRSFGVQAAARAYFDKDVDKLQLHEMAFLAILPKAPEKYGRKGQEQEAIARRNYVLDQMEKNGFITGSERRAAAAQPLGLVTQRRERSVDAGYFLEEVRRELISRFGETAEKGPNSVYAGGLWVRTSLDPQIQFAARDALREGLLRYHGGRAWTRPIATLDVSDDQWSSRLQSSPLGISYKDWRIGVVTQRSGARARIGFADGSEAPLIGLPDALKAGDVIAVSPSGNGFAVRTIPEAQGALVVEQAQTGRVLAMQGGFDNRLSDFNRATQAMRQPGSTIKPFVYAAGLDNGMTPSTQVDNSRFCYYQGANLGEKCIRGSGSGGQHPMRYGLEQSQNIMTVQIGMTAGMPNVVKGIEKLGIGKFPAYPSTALGAGETTLVKMVAAYSALANHGRLAPPTLIDYVQDRRGKVLWRADTRDCNGCNMPKWDGKPMPRFGVMGTQAMDARTAFQVMHMLRGAVSRGTATVLNSLGLPLFGKTGTTTGPKDVWFIGGTQQMIAGAYVGFDQPRNMGGYAFGGTISAPIIKSLIEKTKSKWSDLPPVAPAGVRMVRIDRRSGKRVFDGWPTDDPRSAIIWEAFKPDTEPERYTRQDAILAKRNEILALIRAGRQSAAAAVVDDAPAEEASVVEEGGVD